MPVGDLSALNISRHGWFTVYNATYTNTNAKKGKNYYKFKVVVKNADGTVILTTALKDCKYACRTIK